MHKYEIIITTVNSTSRPVRTYYASVCRVTVVNDVKILDCIGSPDVDFCDRADKEKVLKSAMKIVENDKLSNKGD